MENLRNPRVLGTQYRVYDKDGKYKRTIDKTDEKNLDESDWLKGVTCFVINEKGEVLIEVRANKGLTPGKNDLCSGHLDNDETETQAMVRELKEELGIAFTEKDAIFLKEVKRDKKVPDFKDLWIFQKNISINEITFPDGEATEAKWVTIKQFINMYNNKEIVPTIDFGEEEYKLAVEILKKKKLERYYNNTEADTPKKNVKYFVDNISPTFGKAIDIGCGAGNDSVYLIKNGWSVVSIDKENVGERISKRLDAEEQKRFKFQQQNFNDMKLEKVDLIVANYSLPFCNNEKINDVWRNIVNSIRINGYFVGNYFGIKDSWNKAESNMTFFTKEQVQNLFDEFDIIKFNEVEKEGLTGLGNMKHWHIFNVIAKKNN